MQSHLRWCRNIKCEKEPLVHHLALEHPTTGDAALVDWILVLRMPTIDAYKVKCLRAEDVR